MRILVLLAVLAIAGSARADDLRRQIAPMTRADGEVCDLLRSEQKDRCKPVAQLGSATVYQSGSKNAGVRRTVLAIETELGVLVSPPIDVLTEQLATTTPSLRPIAIDGRPGIALDLVATWKAGDAARAESLVGCARGDAGRWKCARIDVGACEATLDADGNVATACGTKTLLSLR